MRKLRNHLTVILPAEEAVFLPSRANEGLTDSDFVTMGARLANEVLGFVEKQRRRREVGAISFIGHSIGGVVIRQVGRSLPTPPR